METLYAGSLTTPVVVAERNAHEDFEEVGKGILVKDKKNIFLNFQSGKRGLFRVQR